MGVRQGKENQFKNLFYASTEFDLSASENEDEILSIDSKKRIRDATLPAKIDVLSSGLSNNDSHALSASNSLLDNRLKQTCV